MQITFFSFVTSLLWFNLYIIIINAFRKNDKFIISFSSLPLVFFLFLSMLRLVFNFEITGSRVIGSRTIFPAFLTLIRRSFRLNNLEVNIYQLLIFIWLFIASLLLIKSLRDYFKFKRNLKKLDDHSSRENQELFDRILKERKIENKIKIIQNKNIHSPFIVGVFKGKIYLPNSDLSKEDLDYIISHEINHFLGMDSLKKILIQFIKNVFWWNPFAHLFANNFNHIIEIQCDLKTTADFSKNKKIRYLESITKVIKNSKESTVHLISSSLVNIEDIDSLKQRFRIVLNYKGKRKGFMAVRLGTCFLALSLYLLSYFIIIQPRYEPVNDGLYKEADIETSNSFILEKSDGGYDIFLDSFFRYSIDNLNDLNEDLEDLPIYKEGD